MNIARAIRSLFWFDCCNVQIFLSRSFVMIKWARYRYYVLWIDLLSFPLWVINYSSEDLFALSNVILHNHFCLLLMHWDHYLTFCGIVVFVFICLIYYEFLSALYPIWCSCFASDIYNCIAFHMVYAFFYFVVLKYFIICWRWLRWKKKFFDFFYKYFIHLNCFTWLFLMFTRVAWAWALSCEWDGGTFLSSF